MLSTSDTLQDLLKWSVEQCQGYPGVQIKNMHSSWKNGLAFCAIIHRYRPDLIDFHSLAPDNSRINNELAFRIAREHFGIPDLVDAQALDKANAPDSLSIATYVGTLRNYFVDRNPEGGPNVRVRTGNQTALQEVNGSADSNDQNDADRENAANERIESSQKNASQVTPQTCVVCKRRVFILDRYVLNGSGQVCHKSCAISGQIETLLDAKRKHEDAQQRRVGQGPSESNVLPRVSDQGSTLDAEVSSSSSCPSTSANCKGSSQTQEDASQCLIPKEIKANFNNAANLDNASCTKRPSTDASTKAKVDTSPFSVGAEEVTTTNSSVSRRSRNPFAPERPPQPRILSAMNATPVSSPQTKKPADKQTKEYPKALNPFEVDDEIQSDASGFAGIDSNNSDTVTGSPSLPSNKETQKSRSRLVFAGRNEEETKKGTADADTIQVVQNNVATKPKPPRPAPPVIAAAYNRSSMINAQGGSSSASSTDTVLSKRVVRTAKEFGGAQTYDELLDALTELRTRQLELEKRARELELSLRGEEVQSLVENFKIGDSTIRSTYFTSDSSVASDSGKSANSKSKGSILAKVKKQKKHKRTSSSERAAKSASLSNKLLREWFALVAERSELFARESELMAFARLRQLDDLHTEIEFDLRHLHHKRQSGELNQEEISREKELIRQLSQVVQDRAQLSEQIVDMMNRHRHWKGNS